VPNWHFQHLNALVFIFDAGFAAREGAIGIYALEETRKRGDIAGQMMPFQFTIEDNTRGQGDPRHPALKDGNPYKVC
jgi:hypothetical protein